MPDQPILNYFTRPTESSFLPILITPLIALFLISFLPTWPIVDRGRWEFSIDYVSLPQSLRALPPPGARRTDFEWQYFYKISIALAVGLASGATITYARNHPVPDEYL